MKIDKRIEELERRFGPDGIILTMQDGHEKLLRLGRGRNMLDLFDSIMSVPNSSEAQMILASTAAVEPGGGRICELIRALLPHEEMNMQKENF